MAILFRKGSVSETEKVIRFLDEIKDAMLQKDWLYLDPSEEICAMMHNGTMELWLAEEGSRLAAVFTILHPGLANYNYGYDLRFSETELLQVVHMDTAAVHPDYRGRGFQIKMMLMAEQALTGRGRRILLSTVHPQNQYSLNNLLRQGYIIQKQVEKYGSVRCILRKDIF